MVGREKQNQMSHPPRQERLEKSKGDVYCSSKSHFSGISWKVLSGNVRLMVIGKIPAPSSFKAMSIGLENPSETSMSMGAPMDICRALAPTILAFSNRVILGGPIVIFFFSDVF